MAELPPVKRVRRGKGWLEYKGKRYWVGTADPFGLLIYDPEAQGGVRGNRVNLFIVDQHRTASFVVDGGVREIVRAVEPAKGEHAKAVAEYAEARPTPRPLASSSTASRRRAREAAARRQLGGGPRETHCWSCREHLSSVDSPVCKQCGWIVCSCGACSRTCAVP